MGKTKDTQVAEAKPADDAKIADRAAPAERKAAPPSEAKAQEAEATKSKEAEAAAEEGKNLDADDGPEMSKEALLDLFSNPELIRSLQNLDDATAE